MELQTCLKTTLKNKYQKLNKAFADKSLLPPNLCYRDIQNNYPLPNLLQHELRFVDRSDQNLGDTFETEPLSDILKCDCKHDSSKRTVISIGVCGVGKTTTVQSCALAWAEGKGYQNIRLLFPLSFWELELIKRKVSLIELLRIFYPELKELDSSNLNENNVWFVLDGLDEFRHQLNFSCPTVSDVTEAFKVDILVTNLIRGSLLPNAHVWITTRFSAAIQIPVCHLLKETEVKGFNDRQKEQHFRNIIGHGALANKAMDHVKISRSLGYLCQIPPICTVMANVLKSHVKTVDEFKINRLNLTQIYLKLLENSDPDFIAKLKQLALHRLGENNVIYEAELTKKDISVREASAFSKKNPLVLREEKGLHNTTVFRFNHSSIQDFLAASAKLDNIQASRTVSDQVQSLVDWQMHLRDGNFDILHRFIFGLIKERDVLPPNDPLFDYTKQKILLEIVSYNAIGLFHALREYDSQAFLNEVRFFLKAGFSPVQGISPMQWTFMIQRAKNFEGMREIFELQLGERSDENLLKQLTVILKSRKALLRFCYLTDKSCPFLAAVLSTRESYVRELDLGYNCFTHTGVERLVEGLSDENCRLKKLRLQSCGLSAQSCKHLTKALKKAPKLIELDLSMNEIGNEGVQHLAGGLRSCECFLEILRLSQCNIEQAGCSYLAAALQKNFDNLKELDLSINKIGDEGANELFRKVDITKLTKLEMYHCGLTRLSCAKIGDALKSEASSLVELNLSSNNLEDAGFALLCDGMYAWCALEKLNVSRCGITSAGCSFLAKVLCSVSQLYSGWLQKSNWQAVELKELDLSMNWLRDQGVKEISTGLKNPYTHLRALNLSNCGLTDACCSELAIGLASSENVVSEIDLSGNELQDRGVKKLCMGIKSTHCKLEKISLKSCGLSSKSVQFLMTALKSNPQHLAELLLMGNNLEDSSIRVLCELTKNHKYTLRTLDVSLN